MRKMQGRTLKCFFWNSFKVKDASPVTSEHLGKSASCMLLKAVGHFLIYGLQKSCDTIGHKAAGAGRGVFMKSNSVLECPGALSLQRKHPSSSWWSLRYFLMVGVNTSSSHSTNNCLVTQAFALVSHMTDALVLFCSWNALRGLGLIHQQLSDLHAHLHKLSFVALFPDSTFSHCKTEALFSTFFQQSPASLS